jgi:hypothetical protein
VFDYNLSCIVAFAAGAFGKSDSPVEARQFGDKANDSRVIGAGFGGGVPSDRSTSTSTAPTTTSSTTEQQFRPTFPPLLDDGVKPSAAPADEEINYGEKCHLMVTSSMNAIMNVDFGVI